MLVALLQFFISAAVIVPSAIGMARTTDTISRVTGLGHLLAGATEGKAEAAVLQAIERLRMSGRRAILHSGAL